MPDAESQPSERDETLEPEVAGVLRFELSGLALGPDYPVTAISAEIGRVAIAAACVDQEYAFLLSGLHAGDRAHWTSTTFAAVAALYCATSRWTG